jgi:hypothetical protein
VATFAQVADLQAFTGQQLDTVQAQQALNQATGIIQAWTGQNLFQVLNDTVVCDPLPNLSVQLPETPVTAVSQMQWYDDLNGTGWNTFDPSLYRFKRYGVVYMTPAFQRWPGGFGTLRWPTDLDTIQVTYTHGYATIPPPIYDVCVALAARLLANPYKLYQQRTGGVQIAFTTSRAASELLDTELVALGRYSVYGMA